MTTTTIKREMLHVTYSLDEVFKIPIGVDLNDTSQVKNWNAQWNILYITYTDGRNEEIAAEGLLNYEYPVPESVNIVSVDEHGNMIDEDDDEYDCEEDCEEDCDDCPECGKGLTDLSHKRDKGYVGDYMICDACYEDKYEVRD